MISLNLSVIRKIVKRRNRSLVFASLLLLACPGAHAQVPTPQTGGSGQSDANTPPPDAKPAAPKQADKPAAAAKKTTAKSKKTAKPATVPVEKVASAEPDKVLYDRSQDDLKHGRYTEGRLALQTLINTYPDSEYLAKAKLMVADSYYKEGGTGNLTQAIQEYKDFQTFFPFLDEASYAQMQVGLAHYHMMEKADRDTTQAQAAEDEFQAFLIKYPQSPLAPKAEQYLRDVQEVLADGEFKIAFYYYTKMDYRASAARLVELSDRYPLYSANDHALWMLGDIYNRARQLSKNEDDKNHWGDLAAKCYERIVTDYPLSKLTPDAKAHLKDLGKPIPASDPNAALREHEQQLYEKQHHQSVLVKMPLGMLKGNPDVSTAAHTGAPQLNPPNDAVSATEVLKPGASGPSFTVTGGGAGPTAESATTTTEVIEDATATGKAADTTQATTEAGAEIITPVNDRAQPTSDIRALPSAGPAAPPAPDQPQPVNDGGAPVSAPVAAPSATPSTGTTSADAPTDTTAAPASGSSSSSAGQAASKPASTPPADSSEESTSKKKKGLKKILPW
jgi:outer membrane protein assembly factor BamD